MPHFLAKKIKKLTLENLQTHDLALLDFSVGVSLFGNTNAKSSIKSILNYENNLKIYPKLYSLKSNTLALIPIKFHKTIFFLQEIERENDLLINGLKITRPTPAEILKSALRTISQDYKIISHNLTPHHKSFSHSIFLLSPKELLTRIFGVFDLYHLSNANNTDSKDSTKTRSNQIPKLKTTRKIFLEIGFGSGRNILHLAKNNPNDIFIGLEVHTPSIEQVLKNIAFLHLQNLFILHFDARILLEVLPANSLDGIFLHFPVPWNDSKSRRVFSSHFLKLALRVLKKDATLELKTDDEIYFKDTLLLCQNLPKNSIESCRQAPSHFNTSIKQQNMQQNITDFLDSNSLDSKNSTLNKAQSSHIISKYEARWLRQNKDIFTLKIKSLRQNRNILIKWHFLFDKNLVKSVLSKLDSLLLDSTLLDLNDLQHKLPNNLQEKSPKTNKNLASLIRKKEVFSSGFLHISDIFAYKSSNLTRLAFVLKMGDFSQPTSCVVLFECDNTQSKNIIKSCYLKEPPLPTKATIKAHKRFISLLEKL